MPVRPVRDAVGESGAPRARRGGFVRDRGRCRATRTVLACAVLLASACGSAPPRSSRTSGPPQRQRCTAALRFEEPEAGAGNDPAERPRTVVTLVLICEGRATASLPISEEVGACYPIDGGSALLRARCWWAGEGATIEVHRRGDRLIVLRAPVDEHMGVADPQSVGEIEIPEGADVGAL